ncbi:MAG: tRNA (adenosine(37)-N6)-threonylcarbamoyltransferase complex ATPase subunit type 1 TsaE [Candidatus Omnitrophica bacterium]|jgi:tRNA threonylcarbamoyladenosine biosynthesis protein TsaE|nr:tRNA (adenosine(37)-N6)-threonylcarbamoyltransferase complex ATPase subunit type 1 TsaE [Candidatus Omnitrophota bacterium]
MKKIYNHKAIGISKFKLNSSSFKKTLSIAGRLAGFLKKADIICLKGNLGAGKTVFAKGVAKGLSIKNAVTSPTFVIMQQYLSGKIPLNHFDLYRLDKIKDIADIGYEEYFYDDAVTLIEWPERLGKIFPKECLLVELKITGNTSRQILFSAKGARYQELLREFKI